MSASSAGPSATSIGLARSAIAEKGIARGLWLPGLEATAYRAFSYTGFRIGLYPTVRNAMVESGTFGDADSVACRIAAGATTGAVGSAIFNPIDVVRIRMQGASPYPSTLGAFGAIAREEGILGLWRGMDVCVARAALLSGSQLATYDTTKRWMKDQGVMSEGPALHFTASFMSGVVAQTVTQPVDTLKTLVMANGGEAGGGTWATLRKLLARSGPIGLYRGYWPAMARQGPVMVIQMPIVEQFRKALGLDYF
jgi:solute carrier family 25 uncoupling protein 8/9